jgi:hypothetical protein
MAMLNIFIEFIDGPYLHNQYRGWPMIIYEYIEVADIYISAKEIYGQYVAWPIKRNALLEAAVILNQYMALPIIRKTFISMRTICRGCLFLFSNGFQAEAFPYFVNIVVYSACYWLFEQTNRQRGLYWVPKGVD